MSIESTSLGTEEARPARPIRVENQSVMNIILIQESLDHQTFPTYCLLVFPVSLIKGL